MKGFQLGPQWLVIGKDRYPLARITDVRLRTLRWPQHLQRALLCGLQWSAVGWALAMFLGAMAIYLALLLFTVAFVGALANYRSHEVQARFAADEEKRTPLGHPVAGARQGHAAAGRGSDRRAWLPLPVVTVTGHQS